MKIKKNKEQIQKNFIFGFGFGLVVLMAACSITGIAYKLYQKPSVIPNIWSEIKKFFKVDEPKGPPKDEPKGQPKDEPKGQPKDEPPSTTILPPVNLTASTRPSPPGILNRQTLSKDLVALRQSVYNKKMNFLEYQSRQSVREYRAFILSDKKKLTAKAFQEKKTELTNKAVSDFKSWQQFIEKPNLDLKSLEELNNIDCDIKLNRFAYLNTLVPDYFDVLIQHRIELKDLVTLFKQVSKNPTHSLKYNCKVHVNLFDPTSGLMLPTYTKTNIQSLTTTETKENTLATAKPLASNKIIPKNNIPKENAQIIEYSFVQNILNYIPQVFFAMLSFIFIYVSNNEFSLVILHLLSICVFGCLIVLIKHRLRNIRNINSSVAEPYTNLEFIEKDSGVLRGLFTVNRLFKKKV